MTNTATNTDILVSGGGIAGPALAYWLHRAGFNVTVVERAPAPRPGGQTVDLRGAGRTVVSRMGLMDQVLARTVDQAGMACVDARGRTTAAMPVDAFGGEGIISEIEILRGDLAEVLYDATRDDVEYLFDDTVTELREDAHGITVTFENAAPRRFALVVGADGLHSAVRRLAFGPEQRLVRPIHLYTGLFTTTEPLHLDGWYQMFNAPGGLVASARPGRLPGESKASLNFRTTAPIAYDRKDTAAQRELLAERFAGVTGWHVPTLLRAMRTAPDFTFDSNGQVHLDSWSRGRTVLLGDAGYCATPLSGLGTSLALVGAYVLAGELAAAHGDHRTAFQAYDRIMRPYVDQAQELPPGGAKGFAPGSALAIRLRTASMRSMTRWPMRRILAAQFAKAGSIELPEYRLAALAG
jgi:2-polyprenyl-6-methoxyphenol hydroxylase-like FAD-dependent oxidoreductase